MSALDWLSMREEPRTPREIYRELMDRQEEAYAALREAALGLIYLRQRLEAETYERRAEIARLHDEAKQLARQGADQAALAVLSQKQARSNDLARQEEALARVKTEAEAAKRRLAETGERLRSMMTERLEVEATLRAAEANQRADRMAEGDQSLIAELRAIALASTPSELRELELDDTSVRLDLAVLKQQR